MRFAIGLWMGLLATGMISSTRLAYSQSHPVGAFFEKGYAGAPQVQGSVMQKPQAAAPLAPPKGMVPAAQQLQQGNAPQNGAPPSVQAQQYRMRVTLYVSSKDKRHLNEVMRTAFKVAEKNPSVVMAEVYHIGDYRNVPESLQQEAAARKIFMAAIQQPPKNLNIISSPAWVLRDNRGLHIVEGIVAIDKCIGLNGEYKEPQGSMFQEPATPTIGMKSF